MVKFEDRKNDVRHLHMAMRIIGYDIRYDQAELVHKAVKLLKKTKGNTTLKDMAKLTAEHFKKWEEYFEKNKKKKGAK